MNIRAAVDSDVAGIVELLKVSLGERLMAKSTGFWTWKHGDNPFGESAILVAEDREKIVGVRAFMRWRLIQGGKVYNAVRAVDTATHPDYQGKGVFRKLTLQLVEHCKAEGVDFIFNTPNKKSGAGYFKMGWQRLGKLPVTILPAVLLRHRKSGEITLGNADSLIDNECTTSKWLGEILEYRDKTRLTTDRSVEYLHWRYASNPNVKYRFGYDQADGILVFFRVKEYFFGRELRITDHFSMQGLTKGRFHSILSFLCKAEKCDYVTFSSYDLNCLPGLTLSAGPLVAVRDLNLLNCKELVNFDVWSPSLGDLEVF